MFSLFNKKIKKEKISIEIIRFPAGENHYIVSGGTKKKKKMHTKYCNSIKECIDECKERAAYTMFT